MRRDLFYRNENRPARCIASAGRGLVAFGSVEPARKLRHAVGDVAEHFARGAVRVLFAELLERLQHLLLFDVLRSNGFKTVVLPEPGTPMPRIAILMGPSYVKTDDFDSYDSFATV